MRTLPTVERCLRCGKHHCNCHWRNFQSGIPLQPIAKLLGHTSTRMTERYVHPEESVKTASDILANFSRATDKSTDTKENK
jgi:integrase